MAREKKKYTIITFKLTTDAMAMEHIAKEHGIPGRLIPLPTEISAGCGLAWRMTPDEYETCAIAEYGIPYEAVCEAHLY